ncbi:hypothetical protein [Antarcticimicrobium luteum]|uniref:Uncharacterized protein n=1 Tax=Antarcticimicrobium luteum TaxID=2547397 RepID=A0A4R5V689_9RHOB|nr:hypothetical protein [Antarcticimicrobium luteum]TDK47469.1 hypothetical protein E1832_11330 [Antarcticimicrobium luteum]
MEDPKQPGIPDPPAVRRLVRAIWVGGLILTPLVGLAARQTLAARGIPVVGLSRGVSLILPVTLFFEVPFVILAAIVRRLLRKTVRQQPEALTRWLYMSAGSFAGMLATIAYSQFDMFLYSGPGGFGEVVGMMLALWMLTLPSFLAIGAAGAGVGAVVGQLLWRLRSIRGR